MGIYFDGYVNDPASIKAYLHSKHEGGPSSDGLKSIANFIQNDNHALDELADQEMMSYNLNDVMTRGGEPASKSEMELQRRQVDEIIASME